MKEKLYWVVLAGIFGPANPNLWKLMNTCESPSEGYRRISEGRFPLTAAEKAAYTLWTPSKASETAAECEKKKIQIVTFSDECYPSKLKTVFNPPAVLYAIGNTDCLNDELTIGIVGTRNPSSYGYKAAFRISEELAKVGFTTVSGFAAGIDSAAHRGTLRAGGRTVAVLGCGLDNDYPKVNSDIRGAVSENGVLVSEFPPGTLPLGRNFPLRNRIISGLSLGVFVAEAPMKSGALITADTAIEQGRDVFCLPPQDIFSKSCHGVVRYLRDGAVPVFSHLDIIYEYMTAFSHRLTPLKPSDDYNAGRTDSFVFSESTGEAPVKKKTRQKKNSEIQESPGTLPDFNFTENQKKIAEALVCGPLHLDEISEAAETGMQDLLMEITDMEISGMVVSLPGKIYRLNQ
ncbi:MAG: DNA-processing protein DprA [Oscillospiraceae bacterium]|nr:DNA-processing protein DprA [Oscillospiraceae bacterium]